MSGNAIYPTIREEIHRVIQLELLAQRQSRRSVWIGIDSIRLLEQLPGQLIYQLEISDELRAAADSIIRIKIPGHDAIFEVKVLIASEEFLIVVSEEPLPSQMALVRIEFDPFFILRKLDEHLDLVLRYPPTPLQQIITLSIPAPNISEDMPTRERLASSTFSTLNTYQQQSILCMQADPIHLLWGPPGTGKTHTLGVSIAEHLRQGKTCLLLSTSNVAVDELVKATLQASADLSVDTLFRLGASTEESVVPFTTYGQYERRDPSVAARARQAQERVEEFMSAPGVQMRTGRSIQEVQEDQESVRTFGAQAENFREELIEGAQCVASTFAGLVLNESLSNREFDVVYIDEASMAQLPFALAGAAQSTHSVIFAGDFRQLPPICHSEDTRVRRWFGRNIFDHLQISRDSDVRDSTPFLSMLEEQYRMTETIGRLVSELSYHGRLGTGRVDSVGVPPILIDVSGFCEISPYSVQERSYYNSYSALILYILQKHFGEWLGPENLLLNPFRAQSSLMQATARDLSTSEHTFSASTIHRAQGTQEHTVIVDLVAHNPTNPQRFFTGEDAENLINVALSRAQENLIILASLPMIWELSRDGGGYWQRFLQLVETRCRRFSADDLIPEDMIQPSLHSCIASPPQFDDSASMPAVFVEGPGIWCPLPIEEEIARIETQTRLLVQHDQPQPRSFPGITYRHDARNSIPVMALLRGLLCLPYRGTLNTQWLSAFLPQTTAKLNTIACGHLFDATLSDRAVRRLVCYRCNGPLMLRRNAGDYLLACSNQDNCRYSRGLRHSDGSVIVETYGLTCPECHARPQLRFSRTTHRPFFGCSNYPQCRGIVDLSPYADPF